MVKNSEPGPLAEKLDELRQAANLSLYELANRSGINRSQLTRIISGETSQPSTDTLNKLAKVLMVDPEELYDVAAANGPLPSLPTYFRSKYHLTDDQIAKVEQTLRRMEPKTEPSQPSKKRKSPTKGGRS